MINYEIKLCPKCNGLKKEPPGPYLPGGYCELCKGSGVLKCFDGGRIEICEVSKKPKDYIPFRIDPPFRVDC